MSLLSMSQSGCQQVVSTEIIIYSYLFLNQERQLQAERKKKAAMFLNLMKGKVESSGASDDYIGGSHF